MLIVFLTVPASAAVRSMLWRTGRKLYMYARHDVANDPHSNGEYWLLDHVLQTSPTSPVLLDIGANKGDWSSEALRLAAASQRIHVYAFEPSPPTRIMLASRLRGHSQVSVVPQAVSDVPGTATFFSGDDGAGTNSLSPSSGPHRDITPVTTVDEFLAQSGIDHVAMIKID